jgi:hypothetical protein
MGIEMAVSLGRAKPRLPDGFMSPDEEKEAYVMFKTLIKERRDDFCKKPSVLFS